MIKNTIPMIVAVVLAAAAVFAVSRMIKPKDDGGEKQTVTVVAAAKPIKVNAEITDSMLKERTVDLASVPMKAIPFNQKNRVIGQKVTRSIAEGDYVVLDDVAGRGRTLSELVGEGEWAVPVTFADASLVQFLEPGVEIAILGTFTVKKEIPKMDGTEKPDVVEEEATSVVFPCVRILDIGHGDGIRRDESGRRSGTIVVSLTPQQVATLVAAQRTMDLYPALRRPDDPGSLKRRDVGVVTDKTFENLRTGLETVVLPDGTPKK